ncbi:MAG: molybdopterin-dependent oxidoreductase [Desulfocapsaceae bacterium]|nr:molybdopterin-dependent oxidoreductase [Desulfocapsaceae bacterium]
MSVQKTYRKTVCPLDCPDSCGLIATIEDGKVVALNGDPDHPYTKGVICRKMKYYHERLYSDKRIITPMKRSGKKGEGKFERISWDDAYQLLSERIKSVVEDHGGEAILPFVYAGNMGYMNRFAGYPLFNKLGTSRLEETICSTAAKAGWKSHCGDVPGTPPENAEDAELIIIWGSNTKVTNLHFWPYVARARKKGAKLIVIDPYRNITAASADYHLNVEPGEDAVLALALLKILVQTESLDREFIANVTTGFDELESYLATLDLTELSTRCGINEEMISEVATMLAATSKIFIRIGIGMTRNSRAGLNIRAVTSLAAALGLFDGREGRGVLLTTSAFKGEQDLLTWPSLAPKTTRKFNMVQLGNCLRQATPPIKMLFVYNANPLSVTPDGSLVRQALAEEDLFTVVHEQVMTPTARYADLLLPATTFLENKDLYTAYGHFYLSVVEAAIPPCGEAKSNFDFFQELAEKLGFTESPFLQSLDERLSSYLATIDGLARGVNGDTIEYGRPYLSTKWSKGEPVFAEGIGLYSFTAKLDPALPKTVCVTNGKEFDNADYTSRYPFKLLTPPHIGLLNSTFGERYNNDPGEVFIHPDDAAACSIEENEVVTLYNNRGWARRRARITDACRPGLLVAEGIFWQSEAHPAGINDLTSQNLTDMGGGGTYHESRVAILDK